MNKIYFFKKFFLLLLVASSFQFLASFSSAQEVYTNPTSIEKAITLLRPAAVRILTTYCGKFEFTGDLEGIPLEEDDYNFCTGTKGSGFIISGDGYIATSGDVVSMSEEDKIVYSFFSPKIVDLYIDIVSEIRIANGGAAFTDSEKRILRQQILADDDVFIEAVGEMLTLYREGSLLLESEPLNFYVQRGSTSFEFNASSEFTNSDSHYKAEIIAIDHEDIKVDEDGEVEFTKSNAAILKINQTSLPTTSLGAFDTFQSGDTITIIGFPGRDDLIINEMEDDEKIQIIDEGAPTVETSGDFSYVTLESELEYGNRGGMVIGTSGSVVGFVEYIYDTADGPIDGDLRIVRDIDGILDLVNQEGIALAGSVADDNWSEGLELFYERRYSRAIEKFDEVLNLYPEHALAQGYINRAQKGIDNGEEVKDTFEFLYEYIPKESLPIVAGIIATISVLFLTVLFYILFGRRGGDKKNNKEMIPPMPEPEKHPHTTMKPMGISSSKEKSEGKEMSDNSSRFMPSVEETTPSDTKKVPQALASTMPEVKEHDEAVPELYKPESEEISETTVDMGDSMSEDKGVDQNSKMNDDNKNPLDTASQDMAADDSNAMDQKPMDKESKRPESSNPLDKPSASPSTDLVDMSSMDDMVKTDNEESPDIPEAGQSQLNENQSEIEVDKKEESINMPAIDDISQPVSEQSAASMMGDGGETTVEVPEKLIEPEPVSTPAPVDSLNTETTSNPQPEQKEEASPESADAIPEIDTSDLPEWLRPVA